MRKDSGQKFIARNRAPRVQIEYDVETYGAEKKVQLPFVMGVLADLAGKSDEPQPALAERKLLEIDVDNFDDRLRAIRPRASFRVQNTLTGEGEVPVDLTFESMDDFLPDAIARKVAPLRQLLEARQELANLLSYMDGKARAEDLLAQLLQDPALMKTLAAAPDQHAAPGDGDADANPTVAAESEHG
jgi:type VI secretion system protein ImpB